jgi:hypothetical protein
MRKASTRLPEQGTQAPSPAPDLIPAENERSTEDSHCDWYSKRGHFTTAGQCRSGDAGSVSRFDSDRTAYAQYGAQMHGAS